MDFLTKKRKSNEGEVPQYCVQNSHPAIIEPAEFDEKPWTVAVEVVKAMPERYLPLQSDTADGLTFA